MKSIHQQGGAVLPVALFILVIVTIVSISSMDTSNSGLRVAFNQQAQMQANLIGRQRIEQVVSDQNWFLPTALGGNIWVDPGNPDEVVANVSATTSNGFDLAVSKPRCIGAVPAAGYSVQVKFPPEETFWEFDVTAQDQISGARTVTTQGVKMRMSNGVCYFGPYQL